MPPASGRPRALAEATAEVRLSEVLAGLSYALDLTEGQRAGHAARTCLIGMRLADVMGLPPGDRQALFYALLMKDAGCSSNSARFAALFAADDRTLKQRIKTINWARALEAVSFVLRNVAPGRSRGERAWRLIALATKGPKGAREVVLTRCERGADIARLLGLGETTALAIRALDEHWNGRGQPFGLRGRQIPPLARILSLAQTVEVFLATEGIGVALDVARARRRRWFEPDVVDALWSLRHDHAFWERVSGEDLVDAVARLEPPDRVVMASEAELDRVAAAFARVIDAKSPWTFQHSNGVARIAGAMAGPLGLGEADRRRLHRAALMHDLGKLGISNLILDKPGRLTDEEMQVMRRHPADTLRILGRIGCFAGLAPMAAAHHERLDGGGYHLGLSGARVPFEARILCVADICDALSMSRPYRTGLPPDRVLAILGGQVGTAIDPDCYEALRSVLDADQASRPALDPACLVPELREDFHQAA